MYLPVWAIATIGGGAFWLGAWVATWQMRRLLKLRQAFAIARLRAVAECYASRPDLVPEVIERHIKSIEAWKE